MTQDPNDKYDEYSVDFHGNVEHTEEEVDPNEITIDDWHIHVITISY